MNWYGGPVVLGEGGKTSQGIYGRYYRTCDLCIAELSDGHYNDNDNNNSNNINDNDNDGDTGDDSVNGSDDGTKYGDVRTRSNTVGSSSSEPHTSDTSTDDDLCPVCARNLLLSYGKKFPKRRCRDDWHESFEKYKESHISSCLTKFDFDTSHDRFTLPTKHTRNKMLVYNIPPIPYPQFETIVNSGGVGTSSGSYSTVVGSVTSGSTVTEKEKDDDNFDNECVICLEDLKPGDKVGRLECLCVFHYACIKDWFNTKGVGECPVHFLHQ